VPPPRGASTGWSVGRVRPAGRPAESAARNPNPTLTLTLTLGHTPARPDPGGTRAGQGRDTTLGQGRDKGGTRAGQGGRPSRPILE